MLYDKHVGLPSPGSLREALFVTVWMRRQERDLYAINALVQGLCDIASTNGSTGTAVHTAYEKFLQASFPFLAKVKTKKDEELRKVMQKEIAKGAISFSVNSPLIRGVEAIARQRDSARKELHELRTQDRKARPRPHLHGDEVRHRSGGRGIR